MARAFTNVDTLQADLIEAFRVLRERFEFTDNTPEDIALCELETFCDVALRVIRKTNPSKVRDVARTVEIKARLDGRPFQDKHQPKGAP